MGFEDWLELLVQLGEMLIAQLIAAESRIARPFRMTHYLAKTPEQAIVGRSHHQITVGAEIRLVGGKTARAGPLTFRGSIVDLHRGRLVRDPSERSLIERCIDGAALPGLLSS